MTDKKLLAEWTEWQRGNRQHVERSLDIHGLPRDTFDRLDPKAVLYLGPPTPTPEKK